MASFGVFIALTCIVYSCFEAMSDAKHFNWFSLSQSLVKSDSNIGEAVKDAINMFDADIKLIRENAMYEIHKAGDPSRPKAKEHSIHQRQREGQIGRNTQKCGYQSCDVGKEGLLNVHLVPHSHDDVGWLKTVDQYYYGSNDSIQRAGVQYILDSVVRELSVDSKKRFIYVEVAFFARWWDEQHDSVRHLVKGLVNDGRLEFILGGWCMNDEAATHYNAIIDQHTFGFQFLKQNFGECGRPKVAWQIDPFGHSREQASLFAQFGFDGLFFSRLDYQDKESRLLRQEMELMWEGSDNLGDPASLFTAVTYDHYMPPDGFCFDSFCDDQPIMDDERLDDFNVDERVKKFVKVVLQQASNYTTNHIMLTMGGDFQYSNANANYKNMDKLIDYVNALQTTSKSRVHLLYSTPSCYLYSVNRANRSYTTKQDDFFPYAHRPHSFWTGYFTNRPSLKAYVRSSNNLLQVCKQLDVLSQLEAKHASKLKLDIFRKAMAVLQHHDAVSGTAKQHVTNDYAKRLARGATGCEEVMKAAYSTLLLGPGKQTPPTQVFCHLLNISRCNFTENQDEFTVLLYNPVGRPVLHWVHIPVTQTSFWVINSNLEPVATQMVPVSMETRHIPEFNGSHANSELVFKALMPPLGFSTYFVVKTDSSGKSKEEGIMNRITSPFPSSTDVFMKNKYVSMQFDGKTGQLKSLTNLGKGLNVSLKQGFTYYKSFSGNNSEPRFQASGAYIFRPNGSQSVDLAENIKVYRVKGKLVQEMHQAVNSWASQVIRLYEDEHYVEFEWTVGPIPIRCRLIEKIQDEWAKAKKLWK